VNDVTPPAVKLLTHTVRTGGAVRLSVTDTGSGVDPRSIYAVADARHVAASYAAGVVTVRGVTLKPGRHQLALSVADNQETKNMEDVGPILPNTRTVHTTFVVRR